MSEIHHRVNHLSSLLYARFTYVADRWGRIEILILGFSGLAYTVSSVLYYELNPQTIFVHETDSDLDPVIFNFTDDLGWA
jgi:hypothetical protein